jgi:hypothetical protein
MMMQRLQRFYYAAKTVVKNLLRRMFVEFAYQKLSYDQTKASN